MIHAMSADSVSFPAKKAFGRSPNPVMEAALQHLLALDLSNPGAQNAVMIPMPPGDTYAKTGLPTTPVQLQSRVQGSVTSWKKTGKLPDGVKLRVRRDDTDRVWILRTA